MLDYAEYSGLLDILEKSNVEDSYKELMKKEDNVLGTINKVVNTLREKKNRERNFTDMSISEIYNLLFIEVPMTFAELEKARTMDDILVILGKNNRLIYMGILLVIMGLFLFLFNSK